MKKLLIAAAGTVFLVVSGGLASAQSPTMYTLGDIYYYLIDGTEATEGGHTLGPPSGSIPGDTRFKTLQAIYEGVKADFDQCDASAADVMGGKTFFSFQTSSWGPQTGSISANGALLVTGQTTSYADYDDGWYEKGVAYDYTDNGDGTVTDNVTGLMWAQSGAGAGCMNGATSFWTSALDWAENLTFAGYSDWRLPNFCELESLLVLDAATSPKIKQPPFSFTKTNKPYWTSTAYPNSPFGSALYLDFSTGSSDQASKTTFYLFYARAVRDGG